MGSVHDSTRRIGRAGPAVMALACVAFAQAGHDVDTALSKALAESGRTKFQAIAQNSLVDADEPRSTTVSELEVNSYLKFLGTTQIPPGIVDPAIAILEPGRLEGRAIVDLDLVRESGGRRGWFDPLRYLSGRLPVKAVGRLTADGGRGRIEIESTTVGGVPVPSAVLGELVEYYTVTPDNPEGLSLEEPFDLPYRITSIQVGATDAVIVQ